MERRTSAAMCLLALSGLLAACGDDESDTSTATPSTSTSTSTEPVIDPGDGGDYHPDIDPANFVEGIDNPYLAWAPGSRWVYQGETEDGTETTEVVVTDERREVMGISVTVVRDTVALEGEVIEDTYDWYAQDRDGNVWYLGEDTREYEDGEVSSTEGSWEAGVDGALPGIVMLADPTVGDAYRQEYYPGQAEDLGEVLEVGVTHSIGLGDYEDVVVIEDWNPLEPDVVESKYYAPGVGLIAEEKTAGGEERLELVEHTPAP